MEIQHAQETGASQASDFLGDRNIAIHVLDVS